MTSATTRTSNVYGRKHKLTSVLIRSPIVRRSMEEIRNQTYYVSVRRVLGAQYESKVHRLPSNSVCECKEVTVQNSRAE